MKARLERWSTVLIALGLFGLNAALVWPLFRGGYTPYLVSTESTFLTDARFIAEHFGATWNPQWYLGFPFHLFYPPALPALVAALGATGLSLTSAYRLLTAVCYAAGPATFFIFGAALTGKRFPAALAAFIYSLAPSAAYLIPAVAADARGMAFAPWQLIVLLRYGEGPHTAALAFIPLAALAMLNAMRRPGLGAITGAGLAIAIVALLNWIGLFAMALALAVVVLSEMLETLNWKKIIPALACGALAYGLVAFWFDLSFIRAGTGWGSGAGGGGFGGAAPANGLVLLFMGLPAVVLLLMFFGGSRAAQPAVVAGGWLFVFGLIAVAWYGMGRALVPQPNRYLPELGWGVALTAALSLERGRERLAGVTARWGAIVRALVTLAAPALVVVVSLPYLRAVHQLTQPNPDIGATSEYRVAQWLAGHVQPDERVFAGASHAFWLNVFTDVPQVRGGADYASVNSWWDHVTYQLTTGTDGTLAVLWARALDLRYLVVSFPGSADAYESYFGVWEFSRPEKLEGLLERVYDADGMRIYQVPLTGLGLVRVVNLADYNRLPALRDAADADALARYVGVVEAARVVREYRWITLDRLEFDVDLADSSQAVLVRTTYHAGWRAACNNQPVPLREDRVGFMLLEPGRSGPCRLVLQHQPASDEWLGYALTAGTLLFLFVRFPPVNTPLQSLSNAIYLRLMRWRFRRLPR